MDIAARSRMVQDHGHNYTADSAGSAGVESGQAKRGQGRTWTQRLYTERRRRDALFPEGVFGEPAWDLLLALFTAHEMGEEMILSSAYLAADVPAATGRRLLDQLEEEGLIIRRRSPDSRKTRLVELTVDAVERMVAFCPYEIDEREDVSEGYRDMPVISREHQFFALRPNYAKSDRTSQGEKAELLALAVSDETPEGYARDTVEDEIRAAAVNMLGGAKILGTKIESEEDLIQAVSAGFPSDVLNSLRDAGWPANTLEKVVAPKRTLMRRKSDRQRLTAAESDGAWRLAATLALAARVLDGPVAALAWLARPKPALSGQTPVELLRSSVGAAYVRSLLNRLNWGDIA